MMNRNILNPMMWNTEGPTPPTPIDYGIYRKQSLGLISLSSDGETWITIADKNLGASQAYNDGDTLSEQNCGKYFQRGNNYGFQWTGEVATSSTQVGTWCYGPYYESDTYIIGNHNWSSYQNDNLWGGVSDTVKAMQGPATEGFHVPTNTEWSNLYNVGVTLGAWIPGSFSGTDFGIKLKIPFAGQRSYNNGNILYQGNEGFYWTSKRGNNDSASCAIIQYDGVVISGNYRTYGFSVRCFKNTPEAPDNTWTVIYQGTGNAGIFWSKSKGLISISSDGTNRITIQDKNLGATQAYNDGDTLSEANCGKYYQWGNNYGFPRTGSITTSSTQVDTKRYGPYYDSGTFITSGYDARSNTNNNNLWGNLVNTNKSRRGPCSLGYHIPSTEDINNIISVMTNLGIGNRIPIYLKMPFAGVRHSDGTTIWQGTTGYYRTAESISRMVVYAYLLDIHAGVSSINNTLCARGCSIRPFKNEPVEPDSTWTKLF